MGLRRPSPLVAVVVLTVLTVAGAAVCFWILISPGNPLTRLFRRPIESSGASIVIGPYPLEEDFPALVDGGVKTIVTLLNPEIPYERVLLERERRLAEAHGIRLENFPMSSIFGQRFGDEYDRSADGAAEAIRAAEAEGKVYLHCYLGLHRIEAVRSRLAATHEDELGVAEHRGGDRSEDARRLDAAEQAFGEGRFEDARAGVAAIEAPSRDALILAGWSAYRLGRFDEAKEAFTRADAAHPNDPGVAIGLGFALAQRGELEAAERSFRTALGAEPDNTDALYGMALTLFRQGRGAEAIPLLDALLSAAPGYAEARDLRERIQGAPAAIP